MMKFISLLVATTIAVGCAGCTPRTFTKCIDTSKSYGVYVDCPKGYKPGSDVTKVVNSKK